MEDHSNNYKRKSKGGAEKIREKKQKKLQIEAGSCFKIKDMFQKSFTTINALNKNSNDDLPKLKEIDNDQNNLKTNETDILNTLNKIDVIDVKNIKSIKVDSQNLDVDNKVVSDDLSNITTNVDFYEKPSKELIHQFLNYHPCQPNGIDFNTDKVYFTNKKMGDTRKWISYSLDRKSFFCWICIGFGLKDDKSIFVTGYSGVTKHFYDRIKEHEISKTHINNLESFLMFESNKDIISYFSKAREIKLREIQNNRNILERVIETIKMIGKRGLSYRGANEAAYTLDNNSLDHGNLLEILMLISKFDPILNNHVQKCIDKSKKIHKNQNTKGRGDLVSFFSKTTANVIIEGITKLIKQKISEEINQANFFTIQIDTTQDINVVDQCSIVVRYVNNQVHERVVSIVNCKSGKGKDMHELVSNELNKLNIDITKCIGNSTDGAANMQGQYKGFTKWLTDDAPKQLHVWCYAHVLNLVISNVTQKTNESISLFSLLNKVAVFVRESYLRMNFWKNTTEGKNINFISTLGETRWWSKEKSLRKVFGSLNDSQNSIFVQICQTLFNISTSESMNSDTRFNANVYLQMLIKFDTIITAQLFLFIFKSTTPLSNYLQTSGMDLLQSYKMVENTIKTLRDASRKFIDVYEKAKYFSSAMNVIFENEDATFRVEEDFKETRIKRKPKFHDEIINDTRYDCSKKKYEINVYNITLDTVIESLQNRFSKHKEMYIDFEWLHPTNFKLIKNLPENAMNKIAELLTDFSPNIDKKILQEQLIDFAGKWDSLSKTLLEEYNCMTLDLEKDDEEEESELAKEHLVHKKTCKNCIFCCYQILWKYNLYATAYTELFLAYKFLLTLSITQVQCERTFSKLKYILNRLRSNLSQERVEDFIIMSCEKDILYSLQNADIIEYVAQSSNLMNKLLIG